MHAADPVDPALAARFGRWIERRERREPAQHIVGEQEFHGLVFRCDRRALVPRPETEGLVDATLALDLPRRATVVDLGIGSGCIAVTLAVRRPGWMLRGLDRSLPALEQARENAERHGVTDRLELQHGDWADPPSNWRCRADAVVSNPPYVAGDDWESLQPEVRDHDPQEALVPGPHGLEAYREVAPAAYDLLRSGGWLLLELGLGQENAVRGIAAETGFRGVEVTPDLAGIPRVLVATAEPRR